jgi:hypothetical protein
VPSHGAPPTRAKASVGCGCTKPANSPSSAFDALLRQPSATGADTGSGKISSSPRSTPSRIAAATAAGAAFGISRSRVMSVSTGPGRTTCTVTSRPASSARSDCESENAAALDTE